MNLPLLECAGLTVLFGGLTALDGLDFGMDAGEIVGLIGPNGPGKTTFFNALTGIYRLASGKVVFKGADLTGRRPQAIYRAGITRTFQRSRLCLPLSVFDNVVLGNQRNIEHGLWPNLLTRKRFTQSLEQNIVHARALLRSFSHSLADRLFEPASALGMIDRRRVEVCRALISDPQLILLDEPSAGMTHDETRELMDDVLQVRTRNPQLAIVLIEHEMGVIERVTDRCVVLNYGKKISEGPYGSVAQDAAVRTAYLGEV
jgi:branched-chain amino acid transport system ATP-binding protein/sulfate-transporting ATPase